MNEDMTTARHMQYGWSRYLLIETATSAVANTLFSIAFVFLVFHGHARIPVRGSGGLIYDAIPQSFMVGLMSALISPAITRKRIAAKSLPIRLSNRLAHIFHLYIRAFLFALAAMVAGVAVQAVLLTVLFPASLSFWTALIYKSIFGACLAILVTPCALLSDFKFEGTL
jgi:hypothetical protein